MTSLTPWEKIMRASKHGTGLRLSADDVWHLSRDEAISRAAQNHTDARIEAPQSAKEVAK